MFTRPLIKPIQESLSATTTPSPLYKLIRKDIADYHKTNSTPEQLSDKMDASL